jgi:hypothetical protein
MTQRRNAAIVTVALLAAWFGCEASALAQASAAKQEPNAAQGPIRATIVRIDGDDVFLDTGSAALRLDQTLTVYRSIVVRHPVSHASLRDRFSIGTLNLQQIGDTLSLAHAAGAPTRPFEVGDVVEAPRPTSVASATAQAQAAPVNAAPLAGTALSAAQRAGDAETVDLLRYWQATLGKPPVERAGYYRAYLARWPASRRAQALSEEIAYLMNVRASAAPTSASAAQSSTASSSSAASATMSAIRFAPLHLARADEAVDLAASYDTQAAPKNVTVYVRGKDEQDYAAITLRLDGRGHARGRIGAAKVQPPNLDYFVEAIGPDGTAQPVIGQANEPEEIEVIPDPDGAPVDAEPATRVRFSSEFVSFDAKTGDDYFLINEGDFFHRLDIGVLHGMRMGYGHFLGRGGKLDADGIKVVKPDDAGFSFGFVEGELSLHRLFGLATRITVGLGRPGDLQAQRDAMAGGFQLRARIGTVDGTRLVVAGEILPELGQRAFIGLQWEADPLVPMSTEVHVTDQPVGSSDVGVRLVQEVGYRFGKSFALALRPSYQLRTIRHAGPGIGLAATFDW